MSGHHPWRASTASIPPVPNGVKVARGSADLWTYKIVTADASAPADGVTAVVAPDHVMLPSAYSSAADPEAVSKLFFEEVGSIWEAFSAGSYGANSVLAKPGGVALAVLQRLRQVAPLAGLTQSHPAFLALTAAIDQLAVTQTGSTAKKYYAHVLRSYVVSFVEQGRGLVTDDLGHPTTKEALRRIVLPSIQRHGWFLPKGGVTGEDGILDWERGHKVTSADRLQLNLAPMSETEFASKVDGSLSIISAVARPFFAEKVEAA